MNSTLGLAEPVQNPNLISFTPEQLAAKASRVKTMGIIALVLLPLGFLPLIGIFALIASFIMSRIALRISRENLLPVEKEKPAYYASVISAIFLILWVLGLAILILKS